MNRMRRYLSLVLGTGRIGIACSAIWGATASAQNPSPLHSPVDVAPSASLAPDSLPPNSPVPPCDIDLSKPGQMADIISNVLLREKNKREVRTFLDRAKGKFATGDELLKAAADNFQIDPKELTQSVEHWRHINCKHAAIPGYAVPDALRERNDAGEPSTGGSSPLPVSAFAADVTLHVVFHEIGHAVIREFDLMVLGNEETMADAFATHLLIEHFPDRAVGAISARVKSLMIEAEEVPRDRWSIRGEHDNDARRAFQIAALAVAADKRKYIAVAELVGMTERDVQKACDYGADIHRAWRRTLAPLMMPAGKISNEARFRADESMRAFVDAGETGLASTIESALQGFDWHSQVTVEFVQGSGGANWVRSKRTISVNSEYLQRFIDQGKKADAQAVAKDLIQP